MERYLKPTPIIDSDSEVIKAKAKSLTEGKDEIIEKAKSIFYFVRDEIKYNPYTPIFPLNASATLERGYGFCVHKAVLLAALARAEQIPARLGFADVRNHFVPEKLAKLMRTDIFACHGYTELYLEGKWVKATPAFDLKMCQENRIIPVEFDGKNHAIFHPYNLDGELHIEYVKEYGTYEDVPLEECFKAWVQAYGHDFVEMWKTGLKVTD